ncbi:hypothetical protein ETD86_54555 [Nonomuraea turkmeniaca]|uniref:Uncharacterized protein n=1 Tax=Nonomuraea turkmeniaca TaxID=103838 RepID=A0A5S4EU38_9ACTN|nr:hypothetical protein [Nonomuraea turkmeniaca]TMR01082.1 hypothetical protein ETD86_54555 [Nonomuraea turkmeniaca]
MNYLTLLGQTDTWINRNGDAVPIADLPADDAYVAYGWLGDNAVSIATHVLDDLLDLTEWPQAEWIPTCADELIALSGNVRAWLESTPLAQKLIKHGSTHTESIDGETVTFTAIRIGGIRRWVFTGCITAGGYVSWQDAAVEARLQLTGQTQGRLAALRGHEVPQTVHRANWKKHLTPITGKGYSSQVTEFSFDLLPDSPPPRPPRRAAILLATSPEWAAALAESDPDPFADIRELLHLRAEARQRADRTKRKADYAVVDGLAGEIADAVAAVLAFAPNP